MRTASANKCSMEIEIPEISKLKSIQSPEILIHGIPWIIKVFKDGLADEQRISVDLHCLNKDNSLDWSLSGMADLKLLPVNEGGDAIEYRIPSYVFNSSGTGFGTDCFVKWNELSDVDKKYVRDDAINLKVKVMAENPNDPDRCRLNFDCLYKCCDNSSYARFKVKMANVQKLMAIKSPVFTLCGLPWEVFITETRSSHLGALLQLNNEPGNKSGQMTMSIKLASSKKDIDPIKKEITKSNLQFRKFLVEEIVPWDEMVKPENGFVHNGSITLEIEIYSEKPKGDVTSNPKSDANLLRLECAICLDSIGSQNLAVTPCGHMFCLDCITKVVNSRAICPTCKQAVQLDALRRLYLPAIN